MAAIEHTIFKGWIGLFEPDPPKNGYALEAGYKDRIKELFASEGKK